MIIRRRRNSDFTIVANAVLNDDRLGYEALGLLSYLLGRPDNWEIQVEQLTKRGGCGRDKLRRLIRDLIDAGYLLRQRVRTDDGQRLAGFEYVVYDEPRGQEHQAPENPSLEALETDSQAPENQAPENPSLQLIKKVPSTEEERESAQARDSLDQDNEALSDDWLSSDGRSLDDMRAAYPGSRQDSQREIAEAWEGLSPAERRQAFEGLDDFLAERADLKLKRVYLQTYLGERRFARPSAPVAAGGKVAGGTGAGKARTGPAKPYFPPFDRAWWVIVHRWTAAARTGADIHRIRAAINMAVTASAGISLDPAEAPGAEDCAAFVQVWAGGEEFDAWAAWFRRRGVSLPNRDRIWCWFPQRWPPAAAADEADGTASEAVGF